MYASVGSGQGEKELSLEVEKIRNEGSGKKSFGR